MANEEKRVTYIASGGAAPSQSAAASAAWRGTAHTQRVSRFVYKSSVVNRLVIA